MRRPHPPAGRDAAAESAATGPAGRDAAAESAATGPAGPDAAAESAAAGPAGPDAAAESAEAQTSRSGEGADRDLGFGSVVSNRSRQRLLNPDGSFNVERRGLGYWRSLSAYHALLTMSWGRFFLMVVAGYVALNALFAAAYVAAGPGALVRTAEAAHGRFLTAFFFSVQTFSTIGYGGIRPSGLLANAIVTLEALVGLLVFALATGLLFARFSRPTARIVFSRAALIAPYRGGRAFEFRIANQRSSQIIELQATVLYTRLEAQRGVAVRKFHALRLERTRVSFFPLSWTIVHPIDADSPLRDASPESLAAEQAEFLILLTGIDETFSQTVHARSSYKPEELVWDARFTDVFNPPDVGGRITIGDGPAAPLRADRPSTAVTEVPR